MPVEIRLLGGFEVVVDGERLPGQAWRRRSAADLVKLLALSPDRRLLRDQVIDALWPELTVTEAAPRLHKAAHYARHCLGRKDGVVLASEVVQLLPGSDVRVDVDRFDRAVEAALASGDQRSADEAVEAYRGDLLPEDLYASWTQAPRETRRLRYLQLLGELGRWDAVIEADPLDEQAHLRLVRDQLSRRDGTGALRSLERMQRIWREELDTPLPEAALELSREAADVVDEPPPRASTRGRTPVPLPLTPTVGRDGDMARVLRLMERARVVTLLGPGGVGKTRLALEVASRYGDESGLDTCFVDLTKVDAADLVAGLVVQELGVRLGEDSAPEAVLRETLRHEPLLLLMDNFEHVIDAAAVVTEIVRWSPVVRILATSRARLNVTGEQVFEVTPLAIPEGDASGAGQPADAIVLFTQVAKGSDPDFDLDRHHETVTEICRTVDGLPLAIELAASHVRTLPPPALLARISAGLSAASTAARDLPGRQRTIQATIDWSLELLGPPERQLFARLGVFAGSASLDAVEKVCGEEVGTNVIETLSRLVDQSLVRRVGGSDLEPRFTMLELLRERARELLAMDGLTEARNRHARYIADVLDDLEERRWTSAAHSWIDDITVLLGEVRAAHAWAEETGDVVLAARICAALGTYWHREGHHEEGRRWTTRSMAHQDELEPSLLGRLLVAAGFLTWTRQPLDARKHWEEAAQIFRELGDDRYRAYSLALGAGTYIGQPDGFDAGLRLVDEGLVLGRQVGDPPLVAQALNIKGELTRVEGQDDRALGHYLEALDIVTSIGDQAHVSVMLANLAYLADHRGDYEEAARLATDALRITWSEGRLMMTAWTVSELAGPYSHLGHADLAARLVGAADAALATLTVDRYLGDIGEHERIVAGLRVMLGDDRYEELVAEGAQLSLHEAVALVLEDPMVAPPA